MLLAAISFSQESDKKETERLNALNQKLNGTFQIQVIASREMPIFPLKTLDEISLKRDENKVTYIWIKSNIRVLILPKSKIEEAGFKPIERIKHLSSSEI